MDHIEFVETLVEKRFLLEMAVLLAAAGIGGWLSSSIKMPAVLGQIIMGIILGPTVLGFIDGDDELIHTLSEIGVIFLMFLAGLETDLQELKASGKGASMIAFGGVVIPFLFGAFIPYFFFRQYLPQGDTHHQLMFALYIGTILTATSVSISVSVLRDMKQLASKQGISILGGAIIDDVLGIIMLAVVTGMVNPSGDTSVAGLILRMVMFFIAASIIGIVISKLITRFAQGAVWGDKITTLAIIVCFLFSFSSEAFKVAAITGAYMAGVIFAATPYRHRVSNRIQTIAYALFTPIFFVSIGLKAEIKSDIFQYLGYALIIVVIAILGKIIGCGAGAYLSGFKLRQSLQVGIGMIARAEVALIVATQGLTRGIITNATFTSIVLLVVFSTIITPPLLKLLFSNEKPIEEYTYED